MGSEYTSIQSCFLININEQQSQAVIHNLLTLQISQLQKISKTSN